MEALDWDDLGFYPCSCGYQICRFCWHRLRTDENGLCPACRQAFPDIPVSFNPEISAEELKKQKRRNKDRKSNKDPVFKPQDLATLRVVQKNLVFVIGLSSRLTQEDLKKEFAHFGKIIKFVHNKSTAYITYSKPEEAIRAIRTLNASAAQESAAQQQLQMVNGTTTPTNLAVHQNIVNGINTTFTTNPIPVPAPANRLKASLGTTKYCNHFLRSQQCPKVGECMYLHEIAEAEASFTKEQMQTGKHVEYEKKLMDSYVASLSQASPPPLPPSSLVQQVPQHQPQLQQIQQQSQPPPTQQQQQQQQQQAPQLQQAIQNTRHTSLLRHQIPQSQQPIQQQQQAHFQRLQQFQQQQQQQHQQHHHQQALLHQDHHQSPPSPPSPPTMLQHQQLNPQQQRQQQQQQQHLSVESDSDDDGLDFDPISVSTSGLQDLLDQHAKQELQMHYLQQLTSSNQALADVLFPQNGRLNQATATNRLLVDAFNDHSVPTLASLAGLDTSPNQQEPIVWPNLSTWNYLQRSGFGFENGR